MEILSKPEELWSGRLGSFNATQYTIELKEGTRLIHQQPCRADQRCHGVLREHIDKQVEAGVIEPAHSE